MVSYVITRKCTAQFTPFHVSLHSRVKMDSTNEPAPNVWVFIAQLVEHCSANAEAMGLNPVEDPYVVVVASF